MSGDEVAAQKKRRARAQARVAMEHAARRKQPMSYAQLVEEIRAITYRPYSPALSRLLCDISREDNAKGLGMLSAVVVHADGDRLPGRGFFELAKELGHTVDDKREFWFREVARVYAAAERK